MSASPTSPGPEQLYREALARGQFQVQHCIDCGKYVFYPRVLCPHCGSDRLSWTRPSGLGTVYSVSIVRKKPADGGDYNVVLVDLAEGVRLMSRVEDVANEAVVIGMRVQAEIREQDGKPIVVFVPTARVES
jgi:uncharacterized OB-fold protein